MYYTRSELNGRYLLENESIYKIKIQNLSHEVLLEKVKSPDGVDIGKEYIGQTIASINDMILDNIVTLFHNIPKGIEENNINYNNINYEIY